MEKSKSTKKKIAESVSKDWKLNPDKYKDRCKKMSKTRKQKFKEGKIKIWNKGLNKVERKCLNCGKVFITSCVEKRQRKYCSHSCALKIIGKLNKGRIFTKEHIEKLSESHKGNKGYWENKKRDSNTMKKLQEGRRKTRVPFHHTKPEMKFQEICNKFNLPYKYTGNSKVWIENVNPDFINCNGQKVCVEIFGDYWHNLPNMIEKDKRNLITLKKYGWKRIVIWEHELLRINKKYGTPLSSEEIINIKKL